MTTPMPITPHAAGSAHDWMRLAESGGAFDFWLEPGEDIYTLADGEPL